jgi:hypothetical protein
MATRTSAAAVRAILGDHYDPKINLTPFIARATSLTDWLEGEDSDSELDATVLEQIECNLAAHFYTRADMIAQSRSTGGASGSFQGQTTMGLASTFYGQDAMTLDVTNALAGRNQEMISGSRSKVQMHWLGKPPSNQTDYVDRD